MQVRYQAAPHTEDVNYNAPHITKQVSGSKQVADFSELSTNKFKTLAGHADGQNLGQKICIWIFQVSILELLIKLSIQVIERLYAFKHDFPIATLVALGLYDLLQLVARTADGETLVIEKVTDAADHQHLMVLVVAAIPAPFHGA